MDRTFTTEAAFRRYAGDFAQGLRPGDVVGLSGPLGAGKTTFVQAAVERLLRADPVSSPTFTFWHRYEGPVPIDHLDLYRIGDPAELVELGLDDAFDGSSIVLVEWWEHGAGFLPQPSYEITIAGKGGDPRTVSVRRR